MLAANVNHRDRCMASEPIPAPLVAFAGAKPPAPKWFVDALAVEPERSSHQGAGVTIETLAWGERGKPGLLLLHGGSAHADWWSHLAPFFAASHRVVASSWSGEGPVAVSMMVSAPASASSRPSPLTTSTPFERAI